MGSDVNKQYYHGNQAYPYLVNTDRIKFPAIEFKNYYYSDGKRISGVLKTEP